MKATHANDSEWRRRFLERCRLAGGLIAVLMISTAVYSQSGANNGSADRPQSNSGNGSLDKPQSGGNTGSANRSPGTEPNGANGAKSRLRRLESLTWNPVTEELSWVVSTGDWSTGTYQPGPKETYVIHMDAAVMAYGGEDRRFSSEEAERVHMLMDLISRYAVESTVWWEHGEGEKVDHNGKPLPGEPEKGKTKEDKDKEDSKPRAVPGALRGAPIAVNGLTKPVSTASNH
jgi:hypothetical protein